MRLLLSDTSKITLVIFTIRRIGVALVAEPRACCLDELSVKINSNITVRTYEKALLKKGKRRTFSFSFAISFSWRC